MSPLIVSGLVPGKGGPDCCAGALLASEIEKRSPNRNAKRGDAECRLMRASLSSFGVVLVGLGPVGAATDQPRATPWVRRCLPKRPSPEGAKHPFDCAALSGLGFRSISAPFPGRCPGLIFGCPFGAGKTAQHKTFAKGWSKNERRTSPPILSYGAVICVPILTGSPVCEWTCGRLRAIRASGPR